ncbi:MAG: nucleotidyl transferase AbiEii/AbiGii toxin family protein [Candidatus Omnitrophica bacterium]|nr:nucleotidyl transferase AbiEii/AbiGii toxin family protein [Candidatus Omnitrophota bacterium]
MVYNSLQSREIFHLEFLRRLGRKVKTGYYALKGGTNLRFFFQSFRYSEDMDLDISDVEVETLKDTVMKILKSSSFQDILKPFGVERVVPPDISKAKQTQTTQRFKIHLITSAGDDLFTKVEFSRRGFKGNIIVQPVSNIILRAYKLPPLLVSHYDVKSAIMQKIGALAARTVIQARDIFDLYVLSSQVNLNQVEEIKVNNSLLEKAYENIFQISFEQFRDTVILYLAAEDQEVYNSSVLWDEIKLKVADLIDELRR